jgi:hypothetical protein
VYTCTKISFPTKADLPAGTEAGTYSVVDFMRNSLSWRNPSGASLGVIHIEMRPLLIG